MSDDQNNQDWQKLINQLIQHYENKHLKNMKDDNMARNNSFVFLDNNTLHMLITFMMVILNKICYQMTAFG